MSVPNINDIQNDAVKINNETISQNRNPKIRFLGLGGAGTNLISKFNHPEISLIIDTSYSNYNESIDIPFLIVKDANNGSGKLRSANYHQIQNFLASKIASDKDLFGDINVLVFSSSGGSGAVIGPLLMKELNRVKKNVIVITILDSLSQIDILNGLNTLKSIENITIKDKIYLPISIFDNKKTRASVDLGINKELHELKRLFLSKAREIDSSDKINWTNPITVIDNLNHGLHLLTTSSNKDEIKENLEYGLIMNTNENYDSVMILSKSEEQFKPINFAKLLFQGYNDTEIESNVLSGFISSQGIPSEVITVFNDRLHSFLLKDDTADTIEIEHAVKETNSGIIL